MEQPSDFRLLFQLAREYGVQTVYYDASQRRRRASPEAVAAVLRELGARLASAADAGSAIREKRQSEWSRIIEPVVVAWGGAAMLQLRLPSEVSDLPLSIEIQLENGDKRAWSWRRLPIIDSAGIEGVGYLLKWLTLPERLPPGYHNLRVDAGGKSAAALVISSPLKAYAPETEERTWGTFIPLYALHTRRSPESGDFTDFKALMEWASGLGSGALATLPFLAAFMDEPFAPSPYTPASRLMWSEFYLDIEAVPELQRCPQAQSLLASNREDTRQRRRSSLVDYRRLMAQKRAILDELCRCLYTEPSRRLEALEDFAGSNPGVADYARFRAAVEKHGDWRSWASSLRDGDIKEADYDEPARRRHLYAQWLAREQLDTLSEAARQKRVRLYLDLPLGVHPAGYDVWRERSIFASGATVGAPPDLMFTGGQDWEFPPLHPEKVREQGYSYVIAYIRHQLRHAGILRIDHVMGFHRLYWIPRGVDKSEGVYVHYRPDEFYAITCLESQRHQSIIVGEDLGTVPPEVRPAMSRHGLHRMYIAEYELLSPSPISPVPHASVASLETHDMPPFASFWVGLDIEQRLKVGLLDKAAANKEQEIRRAVRERLLAFLAERGCLPEGQPDTAAALRACLDFLAASRGSVLLVNLEDLWLETEPQNIPGIAGGYPNWRRRARYGFEEFCQMPAITATLQQINELRRHYHVGKRDRIHPPH